MVLIFELSFDFPPADKVFACYHSLETANQLCKKNMRHDPRRLALPEPLVVLTP